MSSRVRYNIKAKAWGEGMDIFNKVFSGKAITLIEFIALVSLFQNKKIPFDFSFTPSDGRNLPEVRLTIYLSPLIQFSITIQLCS